MDAPTPPPDDVTEIVDIRDSEITVEDIMRRIRADARRLRAELGDGSNWPAYGTAAPAASADEDLYEHLRRAVATHDKLYVEMILTRRSRWGRFAPLAALRRAFHELVIFYVNTLGSKQTLFNTQAVHTLSRLAERQAALEETARRLEARIAELEAANQGRRADDPR
jgi:hypothetical protein